MDCGRASTDNTADPIEDLLAERFAFGAFRPGQRRVIDAVIAGKPVLAVMPTGAGKSLCYQLPALATEGLTLVVSPLIALMKDQVEALQLRNIAAGQINSHVSHGERHRVLEAARKGELDLLYVAPERLAAAGFVESLRGAPIRRLVVDEAHCVSQWGHDFRPDYLAIRQVAQRLGVTQICAYTATATPEVRDDITASLGMQDAELVVHGFRRPSLHCSVIEVGKLREKLGHILALARAHEGASGIVYCATRKKVEAVADELARAGISVGRYHGGLEECDRSLNQERFMRGELLVMVATNAFGMGIDKADIRFVVHHDMPGSLEAYYQEAGRAGRDGQAAHCVVLFNYVDIRVHEFFIERIGEEGQERGTPLTPSQVARLQRLERAKLRRMVKYCYADICRQHVLLSYFGDDDDERCGCCDRCAQLAGEDAPDWAARGGGGATPNKSKKIVLGPERLPNAEQAVLLQKLLSAFARARGRLPALRIVAWLRGVAEGLAPDLVGSRSDGLLADEPAEELEALAKQLEARGALKPAGPSTLVLTALGIEVMHRRAQLPLCWPVSAGRRGRSRRRQPEAELGTEAVSRKEKLRQVRTELAAAHGVPAYVVAEDALLERLAAEQPRDLRQLADVKGIGPTRLARYGDALLAALAET